MYMHCYLTKKISITDFKFKEEMGIKKHKSRADTKYTASQTNYKYAWTIIRFKHNVVTTKKANYFQYIIFLAFCHNHRNFVSPDV